MLHHLKCVAALPCKIWIFSYLFIDFNSGRKAHKTTDNDTEAYTNIKIDRQRDREYTEKNYTKEYETEYRESWQMHDCIISTWSPWTCVWHSSICHQCIKASQTQIKQNVCETIPLVKTKEYFHTSFATMQLYSTLFNATVMQNRLFTVSVYQRC